MIQISVPYGEIAYIDLGDVRAARRALHESITKGIWCNEIKLDVRPSRTRLRIKDEYSGKRSGREARSSWATQPGGNHSFEDFCANLPRVLEVSGGRINSAELQNEYLRQTSRAIPKHKYEKLGAVLRRAKDAGACTLQWDGWNGKAYTTLNVCSIDVFSITRIRILEIMKMKGQINLSELGPQYNALYGQPLDYRSTGHTRMTDMINAIESLEVRRINEQTGTEYVVFRSNPPPAPRPITAGDHVEAKYNDRSKWRSAKVVKINGPPSSPTYDIMFCGFHDIAASIPAKNVRRQDDGRFYRNLGDLLQENPEGLDVVESIEGSDDSGVVEAYKLRFSSYIPITENEGVEDTLRRAERDGFCYLEIGSGLSSGESKKVFPFTLSYVANLLAHYIEELPTKVLRGIHLTPFYIANPAVRQWRDRIHPFPKLREYVYASAGRLVMIQVGNGGDKVLISTCAALDARDESTLDELATWLVDRVRGGEVALSDLDPFYQEHLSVFTTSKWGLEKVMVAGSLKVWGVRLSQNSPQGSTAKRGSEAHTPLSPWTPALQPQGGINSTLGGASNSHDNSNAGDDSASSAHVGGVGEASPIEAQPTSAMLSASNGDGSTAVDEAATAPNVCQPRAESIDSNSRNCPAQEPAGSSPTHDAGPGQAASYSPLSLPAPPYPRSGSSNAGIRRHKSA